MQHNDQNQTNNNQSVIIKRIIIKIKLRCTILWTKCRRLHVKFIHLMVINHKHYNNCLISKQLFAANNEANKFGNGHKVYNDYSIEEHNGNYKYVFSFKDPSKWKIFNVTVDYTGQSNGY